MAERSGEQTERAHSDRKYKPESHASVLPDAVQVNTPISAPTPPAAISSQCSFFMAATQAERVTLIA